VVFISCETSLLRYHRLWDPQLQRL